MCNRRGPLIFFSFSVSNGVKQGGTQSLTLINIYMDILCISLNFCNFVGHLGGQLLNHLCYADDVCQYSLAIFILGHEAQYNPRFMAF